MAVKNCKFCDREGVLIYPVRYAVACPRGAAGVPGLSGNFRIEGAPQQIGPAKYTLRTIRSGYLYTYDESRRRLKAYMVTDMGYLWNFQLDHVPPSPDLVPFECVEKDEIALARCVSIKHTATDPATNLWIGWSNSLWTQTLVKKIGDAAWRKKHMQCVYVPAMVGGKAPHTGEFSANYKKIAHFACDEVALKTAFAFSNVPIKTESRQQNGGRAMANVMAEQSPHFKGFILALNDPVGITNDLSELVLPTIDARFDEHEYRGKIVFDLVSQVERMVKDKARSDVLFEDKVAENSKDDPDGDIYGGMQTALKIIKAGGVDKYLKKQKIEEKKYGTEQFGRQEAAAEQAWNDTIHINEKIILDTDRMKKFDGEYEAALEAFVPKFEKLAEAHACWLKSEQLANWMAGVHDSKDIRSGYAYSESLAQCIGNAVASLPCQGLLAAWLREKLWDINNLYARALLFNQDDIVGALKNSVSVTDMQLESMIAVHEQALERLTNDESAKLIDRLVLTTGNVIIKALEKSAEKAMVSLVVIRLSLMAGTPIRRANLDVEKFANWMVSEARKLGIRFLDSDIQVGLSARSAAAEIIRQNLASTSIFAYSLNPDQVLQEGRFSVSSVNNISIPGVETTRKWLGSNVAREFNLGVVTGIIQIYAFSCALQSFNSSSKTNVIEQGVRAFAAGCTLISTIVQAAADTVKKAPSHPLSSFIRKHWSAAAENANKISKAAAIVSFCAGIVAAGCDVWRAFKELSRGRIYVATLYAASGALGLALSFVAFRSLAIFWELFLVFILISILIAAFSTNALQEWISKCFFGTDVINRYSNLEDEISDFKNAIGA